MSETSVDALEPTKERGEDKDDDDDDDFVVSSCVEEVLMSDTCCDGGGSVSSPLSVPLDDIFVMNRSCFSLALLILGCSMDGLCNDSGGAF